VSDLYHLTVEQVSKLERMGEKSATKLIDQIDKSKNRPLSRIIFAIGIRHVGEEMAERLVKRFNSIEELSEAPYDILTGVPTIGPKIAESIIAFFKLEQNREMIRRMKAAGVQFSQIVALKYAGLPLSGVEFVITGKLLNFSREEAEEKIKTLGGSTKNDITKKTNFLVVGEDPGSKVSRAQALGVKQLKENELLNMLGINKSQ
jgi:DNA ligase (NAD+)